MEHNAAILSELRKTAFRNKEFGRNDETEMSELRTCRGKQTDEQTAGTYRDFAAEKHFYRKLNSDIVKQFKRITTARVGRTYRPYR